MTPVASSEVSQWMTEITGLFGDFSIANLVTILAVAVGIAVPFFLFWFAYRMIKKRVTNGLTKGSL